MTGPEARAPDPWPIARARILELAGAPSPLLVVTDFDGTLAPITAEPMATRIVPLARVALRRLGRIAESRPDRLRLAVLSGRAALDVAGRVRVGGLRYLGNHGLEGGPLPRRARAERLAVEPAPGLAGHLDAADRLARAVAARLGRPDWLLVELKGPSVAFHYRAAADPDAARDALIEAIEDVETTAGEHGLARIEGRRVIEFRPAGVGGKGDAVTRLIAEDRPRSALALGDDRSDAEGFAAIHAARRSGRLDAGLAVGVHGAAETPPEVVSSADLLLASPREAARLLSVLAGALEAEA